MDLNVIEIENAYGLPGFIGDSTPEFTLGGDGGLAKYAVAIDGNEIGEFDSDSWGNVHIQAPHLIDGKHTITWRELAPHADQNNGSYDFTVDTKAPSHPTITSISKRPGANKLYDVYGHTAYGARLPVQIMDHKLGALIGGAMSDDEGQFFAAVIPWNITHRVHAVALDSAGNRSKPSPAKSLPK